MSAIAQLLQQLDSRPDLPAAERCELLTCLALAYKQELDFAEARRCAEQILAEPEAGVTERVMAGLIAGECAWLAVDLDAAESLLLSASALYKKTTKQRDHVAAVLLARVRVSQGRFELADKLLRRARVSPDRQVAVETSGSGGSC